MIIKLSLTQFTTFSTKVSTSAKMNYVRKELKNGKEYHPALDYWKALRDEIRRIHENNLPIESLKHLVMSVDEKKKDNYKVAINTYIKFINRYNVEYFPVGKAHWTFNNELFINSSPELGLIIDGQKYYVKIYYKLRSDNNKIDKRNIQSTLTLMELSKKDFVVDPTAKFAVLNLINGKLISSTSIEDDHISELEIDSQSILYIWNAV